MKIIKNPLFILLCIALLAFVLRVINLQDNILFAYDQARDAQRVFNMVYKGDIKIVGPETDIQGIFNGPLLYYFLAPIYFFSNFDPNVAALFFVLVNVGTLFLVYWAAKLLFKKEPIALLASLFWATSYEQGFFARYISNASPMSTATTIFFIGLAIFFLKKKQWGLPLSVIGITLAIHCNFYFIYLFLFYPLFFFIFKQKPTIKTILISFGLLGILLAPWIITELKWKFIGVKSLLAYFAHQGATAVTVNPLMYASSIFTRYYDRISQGIYFSFIPSKMIGFALIAFTAIYLFTKKRSSAGVFLLFWLLNTLPLFAFKSGVHSVEVINGSVFAPLTILVAWGLIELSSIKKYHMNIISILCVCGIVCYGIYTYAINRFIPHSLHTNAPSLLKNAKEVIDYTYQKAGKKDFAICSISEPLFINTVWSFLYSTYGKQRYGYLPYWTGQKQILNESFIPYAQKKYETKFIIREPMQGIPDYAVTSTRYIEDTYNQYILDKDFGSYNVQERRIVEGYENINLIKYTRNQREAIEDIISLVPQFSCDNMHE
ncbi:MAG: hypothetical protein WAV30_03320 [Microgenomates group bacterium]